MARSGQVRALPDRPDANGNSVYEYEDPHGCRTSYRRYGSGSVYLMILPSARPPDILILIRPFFLICDTIVISHTQRTYSFNKCTFPAIEETTIHFSSKYCSRHFQHASPIRRQVGGCIYEFMRKYRGSTIFDTSSLVQKPAPAIICSPPLQVVTPFLN
jgi:hypothetical protein